LAAAILIVLALMAGCAAAEDRAQLRRAGEAVFSAQGCHGCHTIGQVGTPIAADLTRIGAKHSETYWQAWLADPKSQKPTAHMPKLALTDVEIRSLAAYLASLR
jgi:mono/diheme cytochrome c family protein